MKLLKYLCIGISALSILSCSDWTSEEREVFEESRRNAPSDSPNRSPN